MSDDALLLIVGGGGTLALAGSWLYLVWGSWCLAAVVLGFAIMVGVGRRI